MPNKHNHTSKTSTSSSQIMPAMSQEPMPTPRKQPWETVGMTEQQYRVVEMRTAERMESWRRDAVSEYLVAEWNSLSYWQNRIEFLERNRYRYNTMRAWSAESIHAVEAIDEAIQECEEHIDRIWDAQDCLEAEWD